MLTGINYILSSQLTCKCVLACIKVIQTNHVAGEHVGGNGTSELIVASFVLGSQLGLHAINVRFTEISHNASATDNSLMIS